MKPNILKGIILSILILFILMSVYLTESSIDNKEKQIALKEISIYNDLYQTDISYLVGGSFDDVLALLKKRHGSVKPVSWCEEFEFGEDANTTDGYQFHINGEYGEGEHFYVWVYRPSVYLLSHETYHLTGDILKTRGIGYVEQSEEAFAYLNGRLSEQIHEKLK